MLPKVNRINTKEDFNRLFKTGRKFYADEVTVMVLPGATNVSRFGFVASKKVGNSVVRHQVARWLRETARPYIDATNPVDVVIVARTGDKSVVEAATRLLRKAVK